ncbi:bestrophin family protein [Flectobacillus roseus]
MIQRKKKNWFYMLFIWHGSVLPQLLPRLSLLLVFSMIVVHFNGTFYDYKIPLNPAPFTLFGLAIALFLGFRNNASYDRYWEGRKLWGALVIDSRSLLRQALSLTTYDSNSPQIREFTSILIAFAYALKHQLRHTNADIDLEKRLPSEVFERSKSIGFKPTFLQYELANWVKKAKLEDKIDSIGQMAMDANLNQLSAIVGGCERIHSTPIPYTYGVLLHRTVYLYCFFLPFGLVDSLGWLTPIITVFIAYTFVAFETIADELEEPFGTEPNDLPLNAMCLTIETTLFEMIGEPVPSPPQLEGYILD